MQYQKPRSMTEAYFFLGGFFINIPYIINIVLYVIAKNCIR